MNLCSVMLFTQRFRSTGSYEPDLSGIVNHNRLGRFRSTGSYEPDRGEWTANDMGVSFDPQALTSLTPQGYDEAQAYTGFDPQALTSLT